MRRNAGFTLLEMSIATTLFAVGAIYIYSTFTSVTVSTANATVEIDLSSQNKKGMTRLFNELQASSLSTHDIDDSGVEQPVLSVEADNVAPPPSTKALVVVRTFSAPGQDSKGWLLGESKEQAREKTITTQSRLSFRKVIGYRFNEAAGTILPEWSPEVVYRVNNRRQLQRTVTGRPPTVVASYVDAFDVDASVDGTIVITLITAKRRPSGGGWSRYANSITVHPKN